MPRTVLYVQVLAPPPSMQILCVAYTSRQHASVCTIIRQLFLTIGVPISLKRAPSKIGTYSMFTYGRTMVMSYPDSSFMYALFIAHTCTGATLCMRLSSLMKPR